MSSHPAWLLIPACCAGVIFASDSGLASAVPGGLPPPATTAQAQASPALPLEFQVDSWTTENGLPQNTIVSMDQTPDGYLWLATFNGLARFDGVRFTVFTPVNTPALRSGRIVEVDVDRHGWLWIFSEEGDLARLANGQFESANGRWHLPLAPLSGKGLDPDGNVWVQVSTDERYFCFDGEDFVRSRGMSELSKADEPLVRANRRWCWVKKDGHWNILDLWFKKHVLSQENARLVTPDAGRPWLFYDDFLRPLGEAGAALHAPGIKNSVPTDLALAWGAVFVTTWLKGLTVVSSNHVQHVPLSAGNRAEAIRNLFTDHEGNLWIGTDVDGLYRLKPAVFHTMGREAGLSGEVIKSVALGKDGTLYAAHDSGIDQLSPGGEFSPLVNERVLWCVCCGFDGSLWHASYAGRVWEDRSEGPREYHCTTPTGPGNVRLLAPARAGGVWVGGPQGLWHANHEQMVEELLPDNFTNRNVRAVCESTDGTLWLGLYGGGVLRRQRTEWKHFGKKEGLLDERVMSLCLDAEQTLWIGTSFGGLYALKGEQLVGFLSLVPSMPTLVAGIIEDDAGYLWLTGNGIHRVAKRALEDASAPNRVVVYDYGKGDGLRTRECAGGMQPTACRTKDGRIWFATVNGLSVVNPNALPFNARPPAVRIEDALLDGRPQPVLGRILAPPGSSELEFHYTALTLTAPEKARFRYRLSGLDRGWVEAGTARVAKYNRPPPGDYNFQVLAANNDGVWNLTGASLVLTIQPFYWQTSWFRALLVLGVGGLLVYGCERRVNGFRRRQAQQAEFSQRLLDVQEAERKRIAHELHDSLGQTLLVLKNRAVLGQQRAGDPVAVAVQLDEISQAASTGLQEVRNIAYSLRPFELDRLGFKRAIETMVQRAAEDGRFCIDVEVDDLHGVVPANKEIQLYRICQEAVSNILKHAQASHVIFELKTQPGVATLSIHDDGKGFAPQTALPAEARGGLGLQSIAERAKGLGGELRIESAPGRGTRLSLEIPINEKAGA